MAADVTVPRLGWTMETGTLVEWFKGDGDAVRPGDPLFALEGDKATETVEALDAGVLRVAPDGPKAGDKVRVGQVVGRIEGPGDAGLPAAVHHPAAPEAPPPPVEGAGRPRITPRARRVAVELGVDPAGLRGSGAGGRVRERDVRAATGQPAFPGGRVVRLTSARRTIAARMVAGVTQAAPVTLTMKADAANLVNLRNQFRTAGVDPVPTINDILVALTARVLVQHPALQAQWQDDGLFHPDGCHVAIGVDSDAGVLAPVIRDAATLSLRQLARVAAGLIARARSGSLPADEMRGATFTVTNLGMFGVDAFTPIIHLPQCAVLGVGRIAPEAKVVNGQVIAGEVMTLSLTFDHRVVDGADAARFLGALRRAVETPAPLLMGE